MNDRKRLLVINDEPDMLNQLERWLTKEGYMVESTLWGNEGVKFANNGHYDLILLDYHLKKELDGEKTARAFIPALVRANPLTPIIVISATEQSISAKKLGVKAVLIVDRLFWKRLLNLIEETLNN